MLLPKFEFFEPTFTSESREIMVRYGANARVLAGGTDLLVNMKKSPAAGTVGMPGRIEAFG